MFSPRPPYSLPLVLRLFLLLATTRAMDYLSTPTPQPFTGNGTQVLLLPLPFQRPLSAAASTAAEDELRRDHPCATEIGTASVLGGPPSGWCNSLAPSGVPCLIIGAAHTDGTAHEASTRVFVDTTILESFWVKKDVTTPDDDSSSGDTRQHISFRFCAKHEDARLVAMAACTRLAFGPDLCDNLIRHTTTLATRVLAVFDTVFARVRTHKLTHTQQDKSKENTQHSGTTPNMDQVATTLHAGTRHGVQLWSEGRPERLWDCLLNVFVGTGGTRQTLDDTFGCEDPWLDLFRRARVVLAGHGAGTINLWWGGDRVDGERDEENETERAITCSISLNWGISGRTTVASYTTVRCSYAQSDGSSGYRNKIS